MLYFFKIKLSKAKLLCTYSLFFKNKLDEKEINTKCGGENLIKFCDV
jgi:hypothetical protein